MGTTVVRARSWASAKSSTSASEMVRVIQRHMLRKVKYPDEGPARGVPYEGIENLRPESRAAVEAFLIKQAAPMK